MKPIVSLFLLFVFSGFVNPENNVAGLTVKFRKVSEDYIVPLAGAIPIEAGAGMKFVKLKLTLRNEGTEDCTFNFEEVYISTEQDSLYRFFKFQGYFVKAQTRIKPKKDIDRMVIFEFPINAKPKELFIEDKKYAIKED